MGIFDLTMFLVDCIEFVQSVDADYKILGHGFNPTRSNIRFTSKANFPKVPKENMIEITFYLRWDTHTNQDDWALPQVTSIVQDEDEECKIIDKCEKPIPPGQY